MIFRSRAPVRLELAGGATDMPPYDKEHGGIVVNAVPEQNYVSLIRKHPSRPGVVVNLKSSYQLSDVISTIGEEPKTGKQGLITAGLNVSYDDIALLLRTLVEKEAVAAEFLAGPLPSGETK